MAAQKTLLKRIVEEKTGALTAAAVPRPLIVPLERRLICWLGVNREVS